jgi:Zn-dependent alcohol dehydrogenase
MRRGDFIATFGSAAVAWPVAAGAQQPKKLPTIGLEPMDHRFCERLHELGADAVVGTAAAERPRAEVLAIAGDGVDHAMDYTGNPELLA